MFYARLKANKKINNAEDKEESYTEKMNINNNKIMKKEEAGARFSNRIISSVTRRIEMYPLIIRTSYYYHITLKVNKAVKSWSANNSSWKQPSFSSPSLIV